jgi:hypothetical protein
MDGIDDPNRNSPSCAVTATTEPSLRWCCWEPCATTPPSAFARHNFRPRRDDTPGHRRALHRHQPQSASQGALREVFRPQNLSKTWSADAVPAWSGWQANQLPAHRHLLAAAQLEACGSEVFAPLCQPSRRSGALSRRSPSASRVCSIYPQGRYARFDNGRDHDARPMIDAARAATSPHFNHKTRSDCHRGALFCAPRTTYDGGRRGGSWTGGPPRLQGLPWHPHDHPRHHRWSFGVVPFLSLDRLQKLYSRHYIMPPMPPMPPWLWSG